MSKYYMPATNVDPECPTEEGSILIDRREDLKEAYQYMELAKDFLENANFPTIELQSIMDSIKAEINNITEELLKP